MVGKRGGLNGGKLKIVLSTIVITYFIFLIGIVSYYRPRLGDDVLMSFYNAIDCYTYGPVYLEKWQPILLTFKTIIPNEVHIYMTWQGRIIPIFLYTFLGIWGEFATACFTTCTYTRIVIVVMHLIYGSWKGVFAHPVELGVLYGWIYFNVTMAYGIMRTMLCNYSVSLLLYLILLDVSVRLTKQKTLTRRTFLFFNIGGLIAGATNELYGVWFIFQFVMLWGIELWERNGNNRIIYWCYAMIKKIPLYLGWLIGFGMCFFAPGNFVRLKSPHERNIQTPFVIRLYHSLKTHVSALIPVTWTGRVIVCLFLMIAWWELVKLMRTGGRIDYRKVIFLEISWLISVVLWGMSPNAYIYGMLGGVIYQFMAFAEFNREGMEGKTLKELQTIGVAALIWGLIFIREGSWIPDLISQSYERSTAVKNAVLKRKEEVHVPPFSTKLDQPILLWNEVNSNEQYSQPYYVAYYGVRVVVDGHVSN